MKKSAAVFFCLAFGASAFASAPNAPVRLTKKAATAATADNAAAKPGKAEAGTAKGNGTATAPEPFRDPYTTPLLLNAKPLMIGRP